MNICKTSASLHNGWYTNPMQQSFMQSTDFNRHASNAADSGIKLFFKWFGIALKAVIDFLTSMVKMGLGK